MNSPARARQKALAALRAFDAAHDDDQGALDRLADTAADLAGHFPDSPYAHDVHVALDSLGFMDMADPDAACEVRNATERLLFDSLNEAAA